MSFARLIYVSTLLTHKQTPIEISTFIAIKNYAFPSVLGEIKAYQTNMRLRGVGTSSGSCITSVLAAEKEIELVLSQEFMPWAEGAYVTPFIDGNSTNNFINVTFAENLPRIAISVFHRCQTEDAHAEDGIDEGSHNIYFQAKPPGTNVTLTTKIFYFDLYCTPTTTGAERDKNTPYVKHTKLQPTLGLAADITTKALDDKTDVGCQVIGVMPFAILAFVRALTLFLKR